MKVVLASKSPRRSELLAGQGVHFEVRPSLSEPLPPEGASPEEAVEFISRGKAMGVPRSPGEIVIAADTLVYIDGTLLGKPHSPQEASQMLRRLSGRSHTVVTGFTVACDRGTITRCEATSVRFRSLTDREIEAYVESGEPMDKAGAYGIQGRAALFVEGIDGDYFNVMGLPLCSLFLALRDLGFEPEDLRKTD